MSQQPTRRHAFISPFTNPTNPYNDCQKAIVESLGYAVQPFSLRTIFSAQLPRLFDRRNLIVLNWTESRAFRSQNGRAVLSARGLAVLAFYLLVLSLVRARVLYFVHNHYVHDTEGWQRRLSAWLIAVLCRVADLRGVLDPTATTRYRAHFLPHPLLGQPPAALIAGSESATPAPQYLIVGAVRRYKALHEVLAHWPAGVTLTIAGRADSAYAAELAELITRRSLGQWVRLEIGFISDADLHRRIREAGALILSHQPGSALVSSAFFEAIGRARRIVARRTPFLEWAAARLPGIACFDTDADLARLVALPPSADGAADHGDAQAGYRRASEWFSTDACTAAYRQVLSPETGIAP
jgi:beta-1,4-mannosyltransferase